MVRNWLEFVSKGNVEAVCSITAPTWKMHGGLPGLPPGPDGIKKMFASFGPIDQKWTSEEIIAEGIK